LSTPEIDRPAVIDCQVVRRDERGIGVCFESLTLQQKKVIETLERRCHKAADDSELSSLEPL
jgi:hypothetical protein